MRSSHQTRRHRRRVSVRVLVSRRLCRPPPIGRSHISRTGFRRARPKNRKLTLYFSVRSSIFLYFLAGKKSRFLSTAGDDCSRRENGAACRGAVAPAGEPGSCLRVDISRLGSNLCRKKFDSALSADAVNWCERERETDRRVNGTTDVVKHLHLVCRRCVPRL